MRVLYVEDRMDLAASFLRNMDHRLPKDSGIEFVHTHDGYDAERRLGAEKWDALLTDFDLGHGVGGVNGGHLARLALDAAIPTRILSAGYPVSEFEAVWLSKQAVGATAAVITWLEAIRCPPT
jgi:hypothetical protein